MPLFFNGKLTGKKARAFEGKPTNRLQFLETDEFGEQKILEIKLAEGLNLDNYEVDAHYTMGVHITAMQGSVFYRTDPAHPPRPAQENK